MSNIRFGYELCPQCYTKFSMHLVSETEKSFLLKCCVCNYEIWRPKTPQILKHLEHSGVIMEKHFDMVRNFTVTKVRAQEYVRGYTNKYGTFVKPHFRAVIKTIIEPIDNKNSDSLIPVRGGKERR